MSEYNGYIHFAGNTESRLLAMIAMKQKDLTHMTPEEIASQYVDLQKAIESELSEKRKSNG